MLNTTFNSQVILQYNENGHITQASLNPSKPSPGRVFVYGTNQSSPSDKLLDIHRVWTVDGTGGGGRGRLLGVFPFDDGRCYQYSTDSPMEQERQQKYSHPYDPAQGQELWCTNIVAMPDLVGTYTLYWVWDWPDLNGDPQLYTSCMDIMLNV